MNVKLQFPDGWGIHTRNGMDIFWSITSEKSKMTCSSFNIMLMM